ncbi:hypothetical protein [Roseibium sp.]|uniref:hypothetical protein n=1 Tax=Roseibium sp. TaxID=1936156 RepID=UPI003A96D235
MTHDDRAGESLAGLHPLTAYMAARGDGPDPRLAAALATPGSTSGEIATASNSLDNVIHADFSAGGSRGANRPDRGVVKDRSL